MRITVSSESDAVAYRHLASLSADVEQRLNSLLSESRLADVDLQVRYVPIVMPPDLLERYPARSRAHIEKRIIDCSPQLNHSVFSDGTPALRRKEYLAGLRTAKAFMPQFNITSDEIAEFEAILTTVELSA